MKKILYIVFLLFCISTYNYSYSQIATWDFTTATPSSTVSNITVTNISQGNNNGSTTLITATSPSNYTGASAGNNAGAAARTGALSTASNGSAYFEFTITPTSGYQVTLNSISIGSRSTSTGPVSLSLRSSFDSYTTDIISLSVTATSTWALFTSSSTSFSFSSATTFRIYGYGGTGSASLGTANWRIDDLSIFGKIASKWWVGTNGNWSDANNWSGNLIPSSTDNIMINSGNPTLNSDFEIPSGYNLTLSGTGSLTINPTKKLTITGSADFGGKSVTVASDATGSGAIVLSTGTLSNASNVTIQQRFTGQRAWRVLSNPFNSTLTAAAIISSNGNNTGNSAISINQGVNDIVQYNSNTDSWSTSSSISANSCYAFFYKGLLGDFNGTPGLNNYVGSGPSATIYNVNGTLNTSGVSITPVQTGTPAKFTLVGNPFAAPVNSIALTGNTSKAYYYYDASSGSTGINVKSGAWILASANSSLTTTIPMMGVVAYESANNTSFTIATGSINTGNSIVSSNLFKTTSLKNNLEINLYRSNNLHDRLILREDPSTINNTIDAFDLSKMENPISNIYTITPNNEHLALNTESNINQSIPVGINAPIGQYQFKVGSNTFTNSNFILVDHYLNQQQLLNDGDVYNFEITSDAATKGENRFEISKQNWATHINSLENSLNVKLLSNIITDKLTMFVSEEDENAQFIISDTKGVIIHRGKLFKGEQQLDMQTSASGMYILKIVNKNIQQTIKIIKQ